MSESPPPSSPPAPLPGVLRFGRCELRTRERRLLVDGQPVALGARAFDLLLALAGRRGELATKGALLDEVWPGLVVEEANLSVQVSTLRKALGGDVIATVPGRGYRFAAVWDEPATASIPAPPAAPPAPAAPVPAVVAPRLIGRDEDLERLQRVLQAPGCVTLQGLAGVGKTSLARALAAAWPTGAVWVDLAPLAADDTPDAPVEAEVERALALAPPAGAAALARAVGRRLLVLDNAEHVAPATARLAGALLQAQAGLHLLVTSQVPLGPLGAAVAGAERVQRIEPLALPLDSDALDLHRGAIALFVARAQAVDHRFHPAPQALPLLREICRRLDGLPLALEMAAARVPALGLVGLRDALDAGLRLLGGAAGAAPARHRTLRAALAWSHSLLSDEERRCFRAFGTFSGGYSLELAVALVQDADHDRWSVIETLATLVDRSLVATDGNDPPRYRLLETMRAYAVEQADADGCRPALQQRHAEVIDDLFRRALATDGDSPLRRAALAEHDNARDAMAWALAHDPARAVELAPRITAVATYTTWRTEAQRWLEQCAAVVDDPRVGPAPRAAWWLDRARQQLMSRQPQAPDSARHARELYLALGDDNGVFSATMAFVRASMADGAELRQRCTELEPLMQRLPPARRASVAAACAGTLAWACELQGDHEGALKYRLQELGLHRERGRVAAADAAETNVLCGLQRLGRLEEARVRGEALLARIGDEDSGNAAYAWMNHVETLLSLGRLDELRALLPRALAVMRRQDLPQLTDRLALLAAREGRAREAALLIGHARAAYARRQRTIEQGCEENLALAAHLAGQALEPAALEHLVAQGALLDDDAAARLALAAPVMA